jgi:hypothetical protein
MSTSKQQLLLLALLKALEQQGSWSGETHVQKCAYFLQEGLGVPLGATFVLYKHGPFSFDLRQALGEMRGDWLIDVKPQPFPYGPSLAVSPFGEALRTHVHDVADDYAQEIGFVVDRLARRSVVELERLGTALFVARQHPELDTEARARRMTELKPHIPPHLARSAVSDVKQLLSEAVRRAPQAQAG